MTGHGSVSADEATRIGERIGIDWASSSFDVEQFRAGMEVELEHGARDPATDVTGDDPILTGKIALAHLNEFPDYYTRLKQMEEEADRAWGQARADREEAGPNRRGLWRPVGVHPEARSSVASSRWTP
jgi:hypothetical protein